MKVGRSATFLVLSKASLVGIDTLLHSLIFGVIFTESRVIVNKGGDRLGVRSYLEAFQEVHAHAHVARLWRLALCGLLLRELFLNLLPRLEAVGDSRGCLCLHFIQF